MSQGKKTAVFGIFESAATADRAIDALVKAGISPSSVSALLPENLGSKEIGTEKSTKAPEAATAGASSGAVLGGALGLLVGVGAITIPGLAPLLVAGPLTATLAGVGAGGVVGGLAGALVGFGIPEYEAKRYEGRLEKGAILVSVHCDTSDEINLTKEIMKNMGGDQISSTGEASADLATEQHRTGSGRSR